MKNRHNLLDGLARIGRAFGPHRGSVVPCDKHRALIVDDEKDIVLIFRNRILADLPDMKVDSASNGQAAVEVFSRRHHAVLLMDLAMPVMDGRQAFDEICRLCEARGWEMPSVIFCTGFAPPDFLKKILDGHPQHGLLLKPVDGRAVIHAIEQRLS